jgi:hypothetical protein
MKLIPVIVCLMLAACAGVQAQAPVPQTPPPAVSTPPAPAAPPETVTLTLPNWPAWGYAVDGAIVILLVREPAKFPVPEQFSFQPKEGPAIILPRVKPTEKK